MAESTSWLRQTSEPAFPDVLWSRPENKRQAGKLLIIGGHQQSFSAVSEAYSAAVKAGVGTARVILPDKLQKMLSSVFPEADYAPSTHIGSFGRDALAKLLAEAEWADGVLLAGDFGKNSETAVLLESFVDKYQGQVTLAGDSVDYFLNSKTPVLSRYNLVITTGVDKIQKLAVPDTVIKQGDDLARIVNKLSIFTDGIKANLITWQAGNIVVASQGRISTTPAKPVREDDIAAYASVWFVQQPAKPFEALTTAAYYLNE